MKAHIGLVTLAVVASSLSLSSAVLADSGTSVTVAGQTINATTDNGSVASDNSLVNVSGNAVNANPSVCANVLSSGSCTSTADQTGNTGNGGSALGASTGNNGVASGNSLVNVSGNAVNVNPAVCANVASSGNCSSTATQTATTGGGTGGGVLGASTDASNVGGGALPKTGMASFLAVMLSLAGSAGAAVVARKRQLMA